MLIERLLLDEFPTSHVQAAMSREPSTRRWIENYSYKSKLIRVLCRYQEMNEGRVNSANSAVPRTIVQFWNDEPPEDVLPLIDTWKNVPGWDHILFNDEAARAFIKDTYDAEAVQAYVYANHPVFRCDLFRYLYLAEKGGVYIDADEKRISSSNLDGLFRHEITFSAHSWINSSSNPLGIKQGLLPVQEALNIDLADSFISYYFNNSPIGAIAKHEVLKDAAASSIKILTEARIKAEPPNLKITTSPAIWTKTALAWLLHHGIVETIDTIGVILNWNNTYAHTVWAKYKSTERNWRTP